MSATESNVKTACILVTGSNGGVGHEIVEYLLADGFTNVICHVRTKQERIQATLERHGFDSKSRIFAADLSSESDVTGMRTQIETRFGAVNILLNVAGSSSNGMSWKLSLDQFRSVIDNNLTSAFLCTREFLPGMRQLQHGRIVNFTSIVGSTGVAGAAHYCAAKAGLMGFTKAVASEVANKGVTVNAIALGYFSEGLINDVPAEIQEKILQNIPKKRFGIRNDVGALVKYLIGAEASWMTGQIMHLNGGQH